MKFSLAPLALASLLATLAGCASSSRHEASPGMVSFKVEGMACPNCANHIQEDLAKLPGVKTAKVDFATKTASVTVADQNPATLDQMNAAVEAWKKEHFAQKEDPECLDPANRELIKQQEAAKKAN